MTHTLGPLTYENKGTYITARIDGEPYVVARVDFGLPADVYRANAEFIVKACNSYADMLAALEALLEEMEGLELTAAIHSDTQNQARAAIDAAHGP